MMYINATKCSVKNPGGLAGERIKALGYKDAPRAVVFNPIPTGGGGQSDPQHYVFAYKIQTAYT